MVPEQSEKSIVFKFFGAILILISAFIWGYLSSLTPYKRYKSLLKINSGLLAMENEIRYSSDYIDNILIKVSKIIDFDKLFLTCAEFDKTLSLSDRWKNSVLKDSIPLHLSKEDCEILIMLGAELGMTDRDGQLKNIENSISMLKTMQTNAKEEYQKMSKLKKSLGITIGLFVVIMLL